MKKILLQYFLISFLIFFSNIVNATESVKDTTIFFPRLQEISNIYNTSFMYKKSNIDRSYKNLKVSENGIESAVLYENGNNKKIYLLIGYFDNVEDYWNGYKEHMKNYAKAYNNEFNELNIADDAFANIDNSGNPNSYKYFYSVKYGKFIIKVLSNYYKTEPLIELVLKKLANTNVTVRTSNNISKKLIIEGFIEKSKNLNKEEEIKIPIIFQLFDEEKEILNIKNTSFLSLKSEGDIFQFHLFIDLDDKTEKILKNLSVEKDYLFSLGIKGYKPYIIKNISKNNFEYSNENIKIKRTWGDVAYIFKKPSYCNLNKISSNGIVFNLKNSNFYFLTRVNWKKNLFLTSYDKSEEIAEIKLIKNNANLITPNIYLDSKGKIIFYDSDVNIKSVYYIENHLLKPAPSINIIKEYPEKFHRDEVYIFNGEAIKDCTWQVPYVSGFNNQIRPINKGEILQLKRHYKKDALLTLYCNGEYEKKNFHFEYNEKYNVIVDYFGGYKLELQSDSENEVYNDEINKILKSKNCSLYTQHFNTDYYEDFLNGTKIYEENKLKSRISGNPNAGLLPIGFGINLYPCYNNELILNKFMGPLNNITICKNGQKIEKEISNTGWIQIENPNEKDFNIGISKNGFISNDSKVTASVDNVKSVIWYGTVSDEFGNPINNATVNIEGHTTKTDNQGNYRIKIPVNKGNEDVNYEWNVTLKEDILNFKVQISKIDKLYPDGKNYNIELIATTKNGILKNKNVRLTKIKNFQTKDGKYFTPGNIGDSFIINKTIQTDKQGKLSTTFKTPILNDLPLKDFHDVFYPIKAKLTACVEDSLICNDVDIQFEDPSPDFIVRIANGIEEGTWQKKPSKIIINDPNSDNFTIEIKALGRLKTVGQATISNQKLAMKIEKKEFNFYYEPKVFGLDPNDLPNELQAYLLANSSVLMGMITVFGDWNLEKNVLKGVKIINLKTSDKVLKNLYHYGSRATGLPGLVLSAEAAESSLSDNKSNSYDTAVSIMDFSIGSVDLLTSTFSENKISKAITEKFFGNAYDKKAKQIISNFYSKYGKKLKILDKLHLNKLSKFLDSGSPITMEILKAVYVNAKTTYDLFNQYKDLAYAYNDLIYVPILISVKDELGYYKIIPTKVGVYVRKKNSE